MSHGTENWLLFCAHNSQRTLPLLLDSFRHLDGLNTKWRIVVVNNASTDNTASLLSTASTSGMLTVLDNPSTRKNTGLNLALDWIGNRLRGAGLVAFTDDDITAQPDWLTRLEAGTRQHPSSDLFGGTIKPVWPIPVPRWLQLLDDEFDMLYARTHALSGPCDAHYIYGPNMAIRAGLFASGLRFDDTVGPENNRNYRMGSETELLERLEAKGHTACFVADAMVHHHVRADQMAADFVLARARRHGLGKGYLARRRQGKSSQSKLPPLPILRRLLASELKLLATYLPPLRARHIKVRYGREWLRGYADGYRDSQPID